MASRSSKKSGKSEQSKLPQKLTTVDLHLAMYTDGPNFKHWALFVDDDENPMILHIQGSTGNWRYEQKNHHDPRTSNRFHQMIKVGTIRKSQIQRLVSSAEVLEIKQMKSNWNCQNWVLDLIADIDGTLINISDAAWDSLCQKMDGLS